MPEIVRVSVVGTGRAGLVHARNFRWSVPNAQLVSVVDADRSKAEAAGRELDLEPIRAEGAIPLSQARDHLTVTRHLVSSRQCREHP